MKIDKKTKIGSKFESLKLYKGFMYIMETTVFNVMSPNPVIELLHSNHLHIAFNDQVVEGFL